MSWGANEWAALGGILSAVATAASAYYAAVAARGSKEASENAAQQIRIAEESRKIQIVPSVVIHCIPQRIGYNTSHLVVENVGPGAAINIRIKIIKGEDFKIYDKIPLADWSPIKDGISVLPSGSRLETKLGSLLKYENGENKLLTTDFMFEVNFDDIEGKSYPPRRYKINIAPLMGTVYSETDEQKIVKQLKSIADSTRTIATKYR